MADELENLRRRLVVGHKRDGRSVYDETAQSQLVALCRQPGASVLRLARECGVNANQVSRWLRKHAYGGLARKGVVSVAPIPAACVAVALPPPPIETCDRDSSVIATALDLQTRLPNGVAIKLHVIGLRHFSAVIDALGEAAVFRFDEGLQVYLHRVPVDFRLSINA